MGSSRLDILIARLLAAVMLVQSALGLLFPAAYRDVPWIRATWFANDWVTLLVVAPLLAATAIRPDDADPRRTLCRAACAGYGVYNYLFYALGAALNPFFPLYVAALVVAIVTLIVTARELDPADFAKRYGRDTPVALGGGWLAVIALGLAAAWLGLSALHVFYDAPTPVAPDAFRLIAVLDLALLAPALLAGGVLLCLRRPWGYVIAPAAAVLGALYLLVLTGGSLVIVHRGLVPAPGESPIWGTLCVLTMIDAAALLSRLRVQAAGRSSVKVLPFPS